ncbi:hypothetical protein RCL1_005639 [Eukaryota sp. TZLM3-RCL]
MNSYEDHIKQCLEELKERQVQKAAQIQSLSECHYEAFLSTVTNLLETKEVAAELRTELSRAANSVESVGNSATSDLTNLISHRTALFNIGMTMHTVKAVYTALDVLSQAIDSFKSNNFLLCVTKINQLEEVILPRIEGTSIKTKIDDFLPTLIEHISQKSMQSCHLWLNDLNDITTAKNLCQKLGHLLLKSHSSDFSVSEPSQAELNSMLNSLMQVPFSIVRIFDALGQAASFRSSFKSQRDVTISSALTLNDTGRSTSIVHSENSHVFKVLGMMTISVTLANRVPELASCVDLKKEWSNALTPITNQLMRSKPDFFSDNSNALKETKLALKSLFTGAMILRLNSRPLLDSVETILYDRTCQELSKMIDLYKAESYEFASFGSKVIQILNIMIDRFYDCIVDCATDCKFDTDFDIHRSVLSLLRRVAVDGFMTPIIALLHTFKTNRNYPDLYIFKTLMVVVDLFMIVEYFPSFYDSLRGALKSGTTREDFSIQNLKSSAQELQSNLIRDISNSTLSTMTLLSDDIDPSSNGEIPTKVLEQLSEILRRYLTPCVSIQSTDIAVSYLSLLTASLWKQFLGLLINRMKKRGPSTFFISRLAPLLTEFHRFSTNFLADQSRASSLTVKGVHPSHSTLELAATVVNAEDAMVVGRSAFSPSTDARLLLKILDTFKSQSKRKKASLEQFKMFLQSVS